MRDRILKIIESEEITAAEFADRIGVQRSNVSHVLNGRNNPGFSFIQKILEVFPTVNPRWLLTGSGDIYENSNKKTASSSDAPNLFSTAETKAEPEKKQSKTEEIQPGVAIHQSNSADSAQITVGTSNDKTIVRVLIFYQDHTFEDFRPAK